MSRFPHLPETFILREMNELERQGRQIALYPLIRQRQAVIHAEAEKWLSRARYYPFLSLNVLGVNLLALLKKPRRYLKTLWRVIWENRTAIPFLIRALSIFPKAVLMSVKMQKDGIEHIHAHYATHPALAAWIIQQFAGLTYSVTVHAHDIFVRQEMLSTKLQAADFVVAISEHNRHYLTEKVSFRMAEKIHVIHCGIELSQYAPIKRDQPPSESFEILNVGSLQPYKGHEVLLQACKRLRERGIPLRCHVIGGGELRPRLEAMTTALDLEDVVVWHGPQPQDEVAKLLPQVDCYVQPSIITSSGKMEGIPVSLMEALAVGLPVVASNMSGIPELVRPNETGYLVPPGDSDRLADTLEYIYHYWQQAAGLAKAGRELVAQEFTIRANVEKLQLLFPAVEG